ncbi:MAG: tetratricopeptide repeat protein [Novosphingobium sp.]
MPVSRLRVVLLIGSSLLMGGCQMLQSRNARLEAGIRIPSQAEPREYASQQFELGRSGIETRNYASAIAAFRNSAMEPEFAAASFNGLAIAYAGIGRNDLAERYFRQAIAADPGSDRYRSNLAKLEKSRLDAEYARADLIRSQPLEANQPQVRVIPAAGSRAALSVVSPRGRLIAGNGRAVEVGRSQPGSTINAGAARLPAQTGQKRSGTLAIEGPRVPAQVRPVRADAATSPTPGPLQPSRQIAEKQVAMAPARPTTVRAPKTDNQDRPAQISTTGRRYSPQQFAEIFAPYAQPEAREPIMASVTSPGLRSNAIPQPVFGKGKPSVAVESLALASQ